VIPPGQRLGGETITLNDISKSVINPQTGETRKLIDQFSFTLQHGAIVGIVGPNGVGVRFGWKIILVTFSISFDSHIEGKTTLLKILCGEEKPDEGEVKIGNTVVCFVSACLSLIG
jgi:ATPase subunit of ABC transporter with duplicated ATPase domains